MLKFIKYLLAIISLYAIKITNVIHENNHDFWTMESRKELPKMEKCCLNISLHKLDENNKKCQDDCKYHVELFTITLKNASNIRLTNMNCTMNIKNDEDKFISIIKLDESKCNIFGSHTRVLVCRSSKCMSDRCVIPTIKHGRC